MKKAKLIHIITNLDIGGAEQVLCELVERLVAFEHVVLYFRSGVHVTTLKKKGIPLYHIKGLICRYDPIFVVRLYRVIKKIHPDCIHTLLWSAGLYGRILGKIVGIPVVSSMHNNIDQNGFVRNMIDRLTARFFQHMIVVSEQVADSLKTYAPWLPATSLHIIRNGIDGERVKVLSGNTHVTRSIFGLSQEHFIIGSVGRFEVVKNYTMLLITFALLYDEYQHAYLVLVGGGSLEYVLRQRADDLGIGDRVIFVVGQSSYPYYPLFDCFVLTSYKEGISMALLEAMSIGIPSVVTSVNTDHHSVIDHEKDGLLAEAGNVWSLARSLVRLIEHPKFCKQIGQQAKEKIKIKFGIEKMIESYDALYKELILHSMSSQVERTKTR